MLSDLLLVVVVVVAMVALLAEMPAPLLADEGL